MDGNLLYRNWFGKGFFPTVPDPNGGWTLEHPGPDSRVPLGTLIVFVSDQGQGRDDRQKSV